MYVQTYDLLILALTFLNYTLDILSFALDVEPSEPQATFVPPLYNFKCDDLSILKRINGYNLGTCSVFRCILIQYATYNSKS